MATKKPNNSLYIPGVQPDELVSQLVDAYGSSEKEVVDVLFNYEWFMYLLQRWESVTINIISPVLPPRLPAEQIKVKGGWTIHDYGNKLVISRGSEWPEGHATQSGLLNSLNAMITVLLGKNNGKAGVDVDAIGFHDATRAAWLIFTGYGINVRNYKPDVVRDYAMLERISKIKKEGHKPSAPEFQP